MLFPLSILFNIRLPLIFVPLISPPRPKYIIISPPFKLANISVQNSQICSPFSSLPSNYMSFKFALSIRFSPPPPSTQISKGDEIWKELGNIYHYINIFIYKIFTYIFLYYSHHFTFQSWVRRTLKRRKHKCWHGSTKWNLHWTQVRVFFFVTLKNKNELTTTRCKKNLKNCISLPYIK